jgi:hypothetical protein
VSGVLHIARLTVLEAQRRRTFLAGVLLSGLFLAGLVLVTTLAERASARADAAASAAARAPAATAPSPPGQESSGQRPSRADSQRRHRRRFERTMANEAIRVGGMWVLRTFGTLMAVVLSAAAIASDRESGLLHTIVTKPISRIAVVLGKWLGLNGLLLAYLGGLGGVVTAVLAARSGEVPWQVMQVAVVSLLFPMLFVSLGMLFSVIASVWVAMGLGLFAWIVGAQEYGFLRLVAVGLRQMGREAAADVVNGACGLTGYLVPTGRIGLWVDKAGGALRFLLPSPIPKPAATLWDLGYIAAYVVGVLALAAWAFQRRDV